MTTVQILIARTHTPLATHATIARSFRARLIGLLRHRTLPEGEALVFPNCDSIHTIGMRFAIDAVFIDRAWRVVAIRRRLAPGRLLWPVFRAWGVIEVGEGTVNQVGLQVGDELIPSDAANNTCRPAEWPTA